MNIFILILMILATLFTIPYAIIFSLYVAWGTTHVLVSWLMLAAIILLYAYAWTNVLYYIRKKKPLAKKGQLLFGLAFLLCILPIGGFKVYDAYQQRYAKVDTEVDLNEYLPFESKKLASLSEPSTLQLKENLPTLDGATAFYPVYAAMVQAVYPQDHYDVYNSAVVCNTTPIAYEMLANKERDMIFAFGPSKEQQKLVDDAQETMVFTPIGEESFVFFVNANNPVDSLSSQQIRDIYSGKITNWKEVGGDDETIRAFQRPEGSGSQTALLALMKDTPLMKPIEEDVAGGMGEIISQTADYRNQENAIGYSFRFFANEMVNNKEIKLLKIDGVSPTAKNIRNHTYPFIYPFYAIHLESNENPNIPLFLEWMTSAQGKKLIEESGYVAQIK